MLMFLYLIIAVSFWYYPVSVGSRHRECGAECKGIEYCHVGGLRRFVDGSSLLSCAGGGNGYGSGIVRWR